MVSAIWTYVAISNPVISEHWPGNELSPVVSVIIIIVLVFVIIIMVILIIIIVIIIIINDSSLSSPEI